MPSEVRVRVGVTLGAGAFTVALVTRKLVDATTNALNPKALLASAVGGVATVCW